ncbi:hypothetical protein CHS0354_000032 [Potamilus streckersoni]|uniref:Uncharacterized protein n=1 Tax=Potamilus streckersoni TaxID=2493646 RepID=A0AAE0RLW0_9BIVA|nr:hypothetical protein CHS0354_000032 [Potamilus streckersoni]
MASTVGSTTIDPAVPWYKKPTLRSRYQDFATFLFDPEESTILGRTAGSWVVKALCTRMSHQIYAVPGAPEIAMLLVARWVLVHRKGYLT